MLLLVLLCSRAFAAGISVGTYNLEFYVDRPTFDVQPKSEAARQAVREMIKRMNVEVLALQEVGGTNALLELRKSLEKDGLIYPYWSHVTARDTNLHVAFLSKHPIVATRHHTRENYLHRGRRYQVARGFGEIEIEAASGTRVTLMTAHLKSKRPVAEADQEELREEEALLLRGVVDRWLAANPGGNLVVLGDLNDTVESRALKTILGRGKTALWDVRPREGGGSEVSRHHARDIVWTHYFAREETYSRIDYMLVSPALRSRIDHSSAHVVTSPGWAAASDHRPIRSSFRLN